MWAVRSPVAPPGLRQAPLPSRPPGSAGRGPDDGLP